MLFFVYYKLTFSLSQMSRVKFASAMPWRENEVCNPTIQLSVDVRVSCVLFDELTARTDIVAHQH